LLFIIILMSKLITKLDLPQLCHTLDPALCHRLTFRTGDEIVNPLLGWSVWCDEICLWYSYTSISPWKELDFLRCSYIQWNISLYCLLCIFRLFFDRSFILEAMRHLEGVHNPLPASPYKFYVLIETTGSDESYDK